MAQDADATTACSSAVNLEWQNTVLKNQTIGVRRIHRGVQFTNLTYICITYPLSYKTGHETDLGTFAAYPEVEIPC